ncbi:MAG: potassium channel family protein [Pelosinus sp.]|nr:potassium channel family protein [Pelosinus sp.]
MYIYAKGTRRDFKIIYDIIMAAMAAIIIVSLILQEQSPISDEVLAILQYVDYMIWLIFVADYVIRFVVARDKVYFVRSNVIDLISILPFDALFQGIRAVKIVRLIYMFRIFVYVNRVYKRLNAIILTNNFHQILWFTFATIFMGATAIAYIEDMNIGDALWWSFVTTTTLGYGDIAPQSAGGRIVAAGLMIVGIGFISMLTGTISVFFIRQQKRTAYSDETIRLIISKLENFSALSEEDIKNIYAVLLALKKSGQNIKTPQK